MNAPRLLRLVVILTFAALPGMCNSALFISMEPNPSTPDQPLGATAIFALMGNQLTIQLNNTSGITTKYVDSDVLTGIYFSTPAANLAPQSAVAPKTVDPAGNSVCVENCDVGSGWEYGTLSGADGSLMNGIMAVQAPKFLFTSYSATGGKLGGTGYGVVSQDYSNVHGSSLVDPVYSAGSATFTMIVPSSFTLATIDHITFVWGSSPDNPFSGPFLSFDPVDAPEPSTWILTPLAMAVALAMRRRSRHSTNQ
jgi:hypothetical protein